MYRRYTTIFGNVHDPDVDVIYITTPHNTHIEFARRHLQAGSMCSAEKSVAVKQPELAEAIALAEEHHVVFAEAMTIWHMPLYKKLWQIVETGDGEIPALGKVQFISSISAATRNII